MGVHSFILWDTLHEDLSREKSKYSNYLSNSNLILPVNQDLSSNENQKLFDTVHKMIEKVDSLQGSTLVAIHNGKESGQEVPHVHVHLIPRSNDDSAGPVHSMFKDKIELSDSEINSLYDNLKIN